MKRFTSLRITCILVAAMMFACYSAFAQSQWKNRKPNTKDYNSAFLNKYRNLIVLERDTHVNGNPMKLIFLGVPSEKFPGKTKVVTTVFYNPNGQYLADETIIPGEINKLMYHHSSSNEFTEFAGFLVYQIIEDKTVKPENVTSTNRYVNFIREFKVDDDTANEVITLLAKDGEWAEIPNTEDFYYKSGGSIFGYTRIIPLPLKESLSPHIQPSKEVGYISVKDQKLGNNDYRKQIINDLEEGAARAGVKIY